MNKKSIAILLVTSSFASSVFAANFIDKLITRHDSVMPSTVKTLKSTKQAHRTYTDFSGTWLMNCNDGPTLTTVIENDDYVITLDGNDYRIGSGFKVTTESREEYNDYMHSSVEWNADGSELIMKNINVYKVNSANSAIETDVGLLTLKMIKGQINVDGNAVSLNDTESRRPVPIHCVLTKKQ